jgi:peptide deformylase
VQHETDHLDGILFIDRMDDETRKAAMKAIRAASWNNPGGSGGSGAAGGARAAGRAPAARLSPHPLLGRAW